MDPGAEDPDKDSEPARTMDHSRVKGRKSHGRDLAVDGSGVQGEDGEQLGPGDTDPRLRIKAGPDGAESLWRRQSDV